jgi:hypothetical protein
MIERNSMMKTSTLAAVALLSAVAAQAQPLPTQSTGPTMPAQEGSMTPPASAATRSDAMTSQPMTEKAAREKLAGAGYGSVTSLKRNDNGDWEAVTKQGKAQQRVTITADGTVSPVAPM